MSSTDCIFCKILRGEIPSCQVYSDEHVVAFMDIGPINRGHTLIVPREHHATVFDLPAAVGSHVLAAQQRVGRAIMAATGANGLNIFQNNFATAGQVVFHVHWHLVPRFPADGHLLWPSGSYGSMEEMQALAEAIRERMD